MAKYKTYTELRNAYIDGELDESNKLMLDNDRCFVYDGDECVFEGNGYYDLAELSELAGFPVEWV